MLRNGRVGRIDLHRSVSQQGASVRGTSPHLNSPKLEKGRAIWLTSRLSGRVARVWTDTALNGTSSIPLLRAAGVLTVPRGLDSSSIGVTLCGLCQRPSVLL